MRIFDLLFDWIEHGSPIFTLGRLDKPFQLLSNHDMAEVMYLASRARADGEYNVGAERYGTLREDLNALAEREQLDLKVRLGNPTGGGIHAKILLIAIGGERWSAVGSLNGSESSHKLNREVVVLTDQATVYERLATVFQHDWSQSVP